jgi:hypothetical protein
MSARAELDRPAVRDCVMVPVVAVRAEHLP